MSKLPNHFFKGFIFFFIIIFLLFVGVRFSFAQVYPSPTPAPSPTPPGYCGDGICQSWIGEDENTCPTDCAPPPAPPGSERCPGYGVCPDGKKYWTYCIPSCTAVPRTCWDSPACEENPPNCADPATCKLPGYASTPNGGCCPTEIHCGPGVPPNCGVVLCNFATGGCYSDCSDCFGPSPSPGGPSPSPPPPPDVCIPPTTPILSSPANGSEVGGPDVTLVWNPVTSWGYNPDDPEGSQRRYLVYLDETSPPSTQRCSPGQNKTFCSVSGLEIGKTYYWKVRARNNCAYKESVIWSFTVELPAWFQTQEGDVHAQGSINSEVPSGEVFCLDGDGGTPGVVSYGTSLNVGDISSTDWNAKTNFSRKRYDYFEDLLGDKAEELTLCHPCDPSQIESLENGIYKKTSSNLRIRNTDDGVVNLGGKKIVILVDGDLNLNANVRIGDDSGFVAFIVKNDINVGGYSLTETGNADDLEGVYIANGSFDLGDSSNQFIGRGIFIASSFDILGRDLGDENDDTPAVLFRYNPSLWFNAPDELLVPSYTWQELAP